MGYTVFLKGENGETLQLDTMLAEQGAEACPQTMFDCELHVSTNHKPYFVETLGHEGLFELYGKKAGDCVDKLAVAVLLLGSEAGKDYWERTPNNAGFFLNVLLNWAKEKPEGTFYLFQ